MAPFQGKLRTRHLEIILTVAGEGSISRAAEQLDLTQSGLSRALAEIEDLAGGLLFKRSAHGVTSTALGAALCRHAQSILNDFNKAEIELRGIVRGNVGTLTIGCFSMFSGWPLAQAVALYRQSYPKVVVAVETGTHERMMAELAHGGLDVLISRLAPTLNTQLYRSLVLMEDRLVIAVGLDHPLRQRPNLELADCVKYPWLTASQGSRLRSALENLLQSRRIPAPEMTGAWSPEFGQDMLAQGEYVWMLAGSVAKVLQDRGRLFILPVVLDIKCAPLAAIWRRERSSSREVRAFAAAVGTVIRQCAP